MIPDIFAPMPAAAAQDDFIESYRAVSVCQGFADGSASTRTWYVETDVAERVAALLGAPQEVVFIPTGDAEEIGRLVDGCPTLGGEFFE